MLSRVANALYWTSRYVERAENVARFVNVSLDQTLDAGFGSAVSSWEALVRTTGDLEWFREHYGSPNPQSVTQFLTFDRRYPNSIATAVYNARQNAQAVRGIISREMWIEVNELYLFVQDASRAGAAPEDMTSFYDRIKLAGSHFAGATDTTLSRGEAWHFLRIGRLLERADKTSRILDVKYYLLLPHVSDVGTAIDQVGWVALLDSASALQMYLQLHHVVTPPRVAEFLLLNRDFPRAIRYCLDRAATSLWAITGSAPNTYSNSAERLLGRLRADLDYSDVAQIMDSGLHEYLDGLQTTLNSIGDALRSSFFNHSS